MSEAIAMHLNLRVEIASGPIHYLLAAATLIDVTGVRLQLLPSGFVAAVTARHPREAFGSEVGDALAGRARAFPHTRCGWLDGTLGVGQLTRQHPLDGALASVASP